MQISFNVDINLSDWAKAIGYDIVGDRLIDDKLAKSYRLADFKEAVQTYIQSMLEFGYSSDKIEEEFFQNDKDEFKIDFESEYVPIKEVMA